MESLTYGVIVGNRGFFPDHLAESGHAEIKKALRKAGMKTVVLKTSDTKYGAVETLDDAEKCAHLFARNAAKISGIIVTLPNFGDEKGVANSIRYAGLDVPVLIQATPDTSKRMSIKYRRDSFCGKISLCNNLVQYGIPFSLTAQHTVDPCGEDFLDDLQWFDQICRVVGGLKKLRLGCIGARPAAFHTVRYSEKILEHHGISVETLDLSELLGRARKLSPSDKKCRAKLEAIKAYTPTNGVPDESLKKMTALGVVIDDWVQENRLSATAIQCWTALQEFYGVVPCTLMSMMSDTLMPSACETDILGVLSMYVLQLASGKPSAIVDWNNNYDNDPDKCVIFHCSNLPKDVFLDHAMDYQEIIAGAVGKKNTYGAIVGRMKPGVASFARLSTRDTAGEIGGYVGSASLTRDPLRTFGGYGVMEVKNLQGLLHFICENGFEHHVAVNASDVSFALDEALTKYLGWNILHHTD